MARVLARAVPQMKTRMKTPYVRPEGHVAPERLHRPKRGRSGPCRRRCRSRGGGDGSHAWCDRQARGATSSAREGERRGLNVARRDSFVTRASAPSTAHDRSIGPSVHHQGGYPRLWSNRSNRSNRSGPRHVPTKYYFRWMGSHARAPTRSGTTLDPGIESDASRRYIQISAFARCFSGRGWVGEETTRWPPSGVVVGARRREGVLGSPSTRGRPRRRQVDGRRSPVADLLYFLKSREIYKTLGGTVLFFEVVKSLQT